MNLKQKTISGLKWSFAENFFRYSIQFIFGVILARLISPKAFGLIGMITIFISVARTFIDSGFSQALIRKNDCDQKDYCTVFYYNFIAGLFIYLLIFLFSGMIGDFFEEPELSSIIKVLGIIILIESLTLIQRTILIKKINFKLLAKISVISIVFSGFVGIAFAYFGFGVWSLVWQIIVQNISTSILLWLWNKWTPGFIFSFESFRELFGFGSKLLASSILDTIFRNIYYAVIGKVYSANLLGFYTKADQFKNFPSKNLDSIVQRVSYPVLSEIQDDGVRLKSAFKKLIKSTMFISFVSMFILIAVAKPLILILLGDVWARSIILLQLLSLSGMLYPIHSLNLNILKVKGRSDLYLRLSIIKKLLFIPIIIIGIYYSLEAMILGIFVASIISYFINGYWSGKLINYPVYEQIKDITPSLILAVVNGAIVWSFGSVLKGMSQLPVLLMQICIGIIAVSGISYVLKFEVFFEIKDLFRNLKFENS